MSLWIFNRDNNVSVLRSMNLSR